MFGKRGAYTNETLEIFDLCWTKAGELAFEGEFEQFSGIVFEPKPMRVNFPICIGSSGIPDPNNAVLRRVARYADMLHRTGFEGQILKPAGVLTGKAVINASAGRNVPWSSRLHDVGHWDLSLIIDLLLRYRDAGCLQVAVDLGSNTPAALLEKAEGLFEGSPHRWRGLTWPDRSANEWRRRHPTID